jgi:hypothetical protein
MKKILVGAALVATALFGTTACTTGPQAKVHNAAHKNGGNQGTHNKAPAVKTTTSSGIRPTVNDIALRFIVKSKTCFGSAGCNIEYNVGATWTGTPGVKPNDDYDIRYAVSGDESGPQIDTLTIHPNGKYDVPYSGVLSTSSQYTKPAIRITHISKHIGY